VQYLGVNDSKVDSFTIKSFDGTTTQVSFTIHGTNDAPVITANYGVTTSSNTPVTGSVRATDVDSSDTLAYNLDSNNAAHGTVSLAADGSYTFTPNQGYNGADGFNITVSDGHGGTTTAVVTVNVTSTVNQPAVISGTTSGSVIEAGGVANSIPGAPTATGTLTDTDVDDPPNTFQAVGAGTSSSSGFGTFAMTAGGMWTYTLHNANPTVQGLNADQPLVDHFTVHTADGTEQVVTITINGTNDAAVITGTAAGAVVEAGGVNNATTGTPTASGQLNMTDVDNTAAFTVVSAPAAASHGTYMIDATGHWNYTLNNSDTAVQALNAGGHLTDTFTVTTADGTAQLVTITINGINDTAVITGAAAGTVVEAGGVANGTAGTPTATGTLAAADLDNTANAFAAVTTATAGDHGYGTFTMTSAGVWAYTLSNTNSAVQALNAGAFLTDGFTVRTTDGTQQAVTITINGTNDAAVISGTAAGTVVEAGGVANAIAGTPTTSGTLSATDVDNTANAFAAVVTTTASDHGYGAFTMTSAGAWTYTLNNTNTAVQAINAGGHLTDTFTAATADGTTQQVMVTINGANDTPVLAAPAAITYGDTKLADTFSATTDMLSAADVDAGATLTYGIAGGILSSALAGYDLAKAGPHGTLYVNSTSGAYSFVPDNASIDQIPLGSNLSDSYTLTVSDGAGGTDSKVLTVSLPGANDASVITGVTGPLQYTVGDAPVLVAPALTLGDADSGLITSAKVAISSGYTGNENLGYQLPSGISVESIAGGVWTFTGTASLGQYEALLDSVTFNASTPGGRTISFTVYDGLIASKTVDTSSISLESITTNGFKIPGEAAGDDSGAWMSAAGDVNGDGFADLIIGAPSASANGHVYSGRSYVVFGKGTAFDPEVPLWSLDGNNGSRLSGEAEWDTSGFSVAAAGDVNGDGFGDVIIGAIWSDPNGADSGAGYVVFGKATGFGSDFQLSTLNGANGFRLLGAGPNDETGVSVSGAGDVNGDGYADVLVGSYSGLSGASYLVFGKASGFTTNIQLSALDGTNGLRVDGENPGDNAGQRVSAAGDINGDGYADFVIGAPGTGADYVVFGKTSFFEQAAIGATLNLSSLDGNNGFRIRELASGDGMGYGINSAGDVNGDGFNDLIVGASSAHVGGVASGAAYVVFGKANGVGGFGQDVDLSSLNGANGFRISGGAEFSLTGVSVSAAGDFNGDGYGDLIVGAPGGLGSANWSGESYVVFGKAASFAADVNLATLGGADGFRVSGVANGDASGYNVSAAGDVDGDGFDDIAVSSAFASPHGQTEAGETYVIFGAKLVVGGETFLGGSDNDTLRGTSAVESFIGGQGNDNIFGNGGKDAFSGGAGNDTIHLGASNQPAIDFVKIDGGSGIDTLMLDGSGVTLDLSNPGVGAKVHNIERIDLTGSGNNTLVLDIRDLLNMSDTSNTLQVGGNTGDVVDVKVDAGTSWTTGADQTIGGVLYHSYTQGVANLLVDVHVTAVNFI
jgi:VCBS repeat-containing protein